MKKKKYHRSELLFDWTNYGLLVIIGLVVMYPVYFVLIASVSDPNYVSNGEVIVWPKGWTLEGYQIVFEHASVWRGFANSLFYAILGTGIELGLIVPLAFALSHKGMVGKGPITIFFLITMYFSGGLIPTYLTVRELGLYDSVWALVLPGAVSVFYLLITRTFMMSSIPEELFDAARIDGAGNTRFLFSIVIPLSQAIIAVLVLYNMVAYWNSYFSAIIYLRTEVKFPLQVILRSILINMDMLQMENLSSSELLVVNRQKDLQKYALIIIASLPVLMLYPLVQKHFIKGIMIGSIKG